MSTDYEELKDVESKDAEEEITCRNVCETMFLGVVLGLAVSKALDIVFCLVYS